MTPGLSALQPQLHPPSPPTPPQVPRQSPPQRLPRRPRRLAPAWPVLAKLLRLGFSASEPPSPAELPTALQPSPGCRLDPAAGRRGVVARSSSGRCPSCCRRCARWSALTVPSKHRDATGCRPSSVCGCRPSRQCSSQPRGTSHSRRRCRGLPSTRCRRPPRALFGLKLAPRTGSQAKRRVVPSKTTRTSSARSRRHA